MAPSGQAVWDFRANKEYYTKEQLIKWLEDNTKEATFQLEIGDSGYEHWQGRFSLLKKRNKNPLMNLFKSSGLEIPNYLAITSEENRKNNFYVLKADTRLEGPFIVKKKVDVYIPKHLRDIQLRTWQQQVIDSKDIFDDRTINLIYDPIGNNGKSTVASIAELKYGAIDLPPINDYKELIALMCNICKDQEIRDPKLVLMDMPRAVRKDQLYGLYSAIEQIKKGKLYDMRYHYKAWWIDPPQVWVFSNKLPDMEMLSMDRWKLWTIEDGQLKLANFVELQKKELMI